MVFSSLLFLCLFLPVTAGAYYMVPGSFRSGRNLILLIASLVFYAFGEPRYILLMLFSIGINYLSGLLLEKTQAEGRRMFYLILSLTINLGLLCFFKYTNLVIDTVNSLCQGSLSSISLPLPIGISFYTFQALSYVIDVYKRQVRVQKNPMDFALYICLFPQLIAGPIVRYTDIEEELRGRKESQELFFWGLGRFICGLCKKVLLANQTGMLFKEIAGMTNASMAAAWIGAFAYTLQIYFDFSGYSDMAIGLGSMFGFHFPENFLHPYRAKSISEFWRRWHVTLGTWFREYLYIPLGGNRKGTKRTILNLLIVWSLTGLWHGAGYNFLLWGLYYFILLTAEKFYFRQILKRCPAFCSHFYTMFFVILGWMIFACDQMKSPVSFFASLFGCKGFFDATALYYMTTFGSLLFIGAFISVWNTDRIKDVLQKRAKESAWWEITVFFGMAAGLILCIVFLAGDSYNPFLYFRF